MLYEEEKCGVNVHHFGNYYHNIMLCSILSYKISENGSKTTPNRMPLVKGIKMGVLLNFVRYIEIEG
jgi:hypothetical protein